MYLNATVLSQFSITMEMYRHHPGLLRVSSLDNLHFDNKVSRLGLEITNAQIEGQKLSILSLREQQQMVMDLLTEVLQIKDELQNKDYIIMEQKNAIENLSGILEMFKKQFERSNRRPTSGDLKYLPEIGARGSKSVQKLTHQIGKLRFFVDKQTQFVAGLNQSLRESKQENQRLKQKVGKLKTKLRENSREKNDITKNIDPRNHQNSTSTTWLDSKDSKHFCSTGNLYQKAGGKLPRNNLNKFHTIHPSSLHLEKQPISTYTGSFGQTLRDFQANPEFLKYLQEKLVKKNAPNRLSNQLRQSIFEQIRNIQMTGRRRRDERLNQATH